MPSKKIVKSKYFFEEDIIESISEVSTEEFKPWGDNSNLDVVGKPVSRLDGYDKVSGSAQYAFDVLLPSMAYARTLRCPLPHAKIKSVDTRQAKKMPGVLSVLTFENAPKIEWYDKSFLFDPHLRYEGDEVACVVAETDDIAERALHRIKVDYEELPFTVSAKEAMSKNAPQLYNEGNIVNGEPSTYERGNVEKGFSEADAVVEGKYETPVAIHNPTEVHCSVVNWNGSQLTVWDSTQAIYRVRDAIAQKLGIPESSVRVIKKYMGGGFGSKLEVGKYTVMAAIIARKLGRPIKITLDRREMNLAVGNRPDSVQELKAGATRDGKLTALTHDSYGAVGAHPSSAQCSWPLRTIYKCANVKTQEYSVFINAGRARPFRAPGHVQGTFALDSLIDDLAEKIGMDPLEFRLKNYTDEDQVRELPYTSKLLKEAYRQGADAIGWSNRQNPAGSATGQIKRGIGMGTQIWWGGGAPPAYATLKLNRDGSIQILSGTQDIGGGTYTFVAQIASEVLETPIDKIHVILGDTYTCPYGPTSGGSMTAPSTSPAVRDAAEQMRAKLLSGASAIMEVPESNLDYKNGIISVKGNQDKSMKINEVVGEMNENVLITTGARSANPDGYAINSFGAQFAEVNVDTLTGKVHVLRIVAAHDIGRVLNKKTLENQIHGGVMQGLGFALMEERVINKATGKVLTTNLHDYKMPTVMDYPEIETIIVSDGDPMISNTGVKGVGEPAMIPTPAAIANAVYNAIGVRINSLPITPDKVLMALQG